MCNPSTYQPRSPVGLSPLAPETGSCVLLRLANKVLDLAITEIVELSGAQDDGGSQGDRAVLVLDRGVAVMAAELGHVESPAAINFQQNSVRHKPHYKGNAAGTQSRGYRE